MSDRVKALSSTIWTVMSVTMAIPLSTAALGQTYQKSDGAKRAAPAPQNISLNERGRAAFNSLDAQRLAVDSRTAIAKPPMQPAQ